MRAANEAILTAIESGLLNPVVLMTAVDRLADELSGGQPVLSSAMERELAQVETELDRLTSAVAGGGKMASLVRAIRQREDRCSELQVSLAALAKAKQWTADRVVIVEELTLASRTGKPCWRGNQDRPIASSGR